MLKEAMYHSPDLQKVKLEELHPSLRCAMWWHAPPGIRGEQAGCCPGIYA
jgi:hypothetical protein